MSAKVDLGMFSTLGQTGLQTPENARQH